jgi:hypothetical protein
MYLKKMQQETDGDLEREEKEKEYVANRTPELFEKNKKDPKMLIEAVTMLFDEDYYNTDAIIEGYGKDCPKEISKMIDCYIASHSQWEAQREASVHVFDKDSDDDEIILERRA